MTDKEQDARCFLCCGSLTLPMSKEEMEGLIKTFIENNLTIIEFTQRNNNLTAVDKVKRIHELSFQALEANKLLEKLLHSDQKAAGSPGFSSDYYGEHE